MADFEKTLPVILLHEGGHQLTDDPDDAGGETYAGITRRSHPDWEGWEEIEVHGPEPTPRLKAMVRRLYLERYWNRIRGDDIRDQATADAIMSLGVLSGVPVAARLAQIAAGADPDGIIGPASIAAINDPPPLNPSAQFLLKLFPARVKRFDRIVQRRKSQHKYFRGWVRRALADLEAGL